METDTQSPCNGAAAFQVRRIRGIKTNALGDFLFEKSAALESLECRIDAKVQNRVAFGIPDHEQCARHWIGHAVKRAKDEMGR